MADDGVARRVLEHAEELEHDDPVDLTNVALPHTDMGNARRLMHLHGDDLHYSAELARWLVWDSARYGEDRTLEAMRRGMATIDTLLDAARGLSGEAREKLTKHWLRSQAAPRVRAMMDLATALPGVAVKVEQLDADPWVLNVANGTLDLRTGELGPHNRAALHTKVAPVAYDPAAAAPTWRRFLDEVFAGDDELMGFVQRFAGYSLTGDVSEHLLVFAHGIGANGKTTLLTTLRHVLGDYGMQLDPRVLTAGHHDEHPTGIADLRGARLVTTAETEQDRHLAEGLVKQVTGGDRIRARRMRGDYFEFVPSHKLWMAGNHLPKVSGTDLGIWRRLALVPFDVTFDREHQDAALPERLAAEAPGILTWMVEGCLEWQRDGLRVPDRVRAATESYRSREDHVGRFLADCAVIGDTYMVTAASLRERYLSWVRAEGEREWSAKRVAAELTTRGFDNARTGPRSARMWLGFGLLEEPVATHRDGLSHSPSREGTLPDNGETRRDASRLPLTSANGDRPTERIGDGVDAEPFEEVPT